MIAPSNALCLRFLRSSLAYGKPLLCRQRVAVFSSKSGNHTTLEDISQSPASTCWSLLSPSPSIIASKIQSLKLPKANPTSGKTPLVVLLMTPAHIQLLDDSSTFIPSLLRLAVEFTQPWHDFNLLAAVIDRIPYTRPTISTGLRDSHAANVKSSPGTEDGLEGISVAVLDSEAAAPDLWSSKNMKIGRETMTVQQRCTLSFSFPPSPVVRSQLSDESVSQPLVQRMLQLPVANTLFQNGRQSTLFAQRWSIRYSKESTPEHLCSKRDWLPQQMIHMGAVFADEDMRLRPDHFVNSHLVPITPARTIAAAVGNIIGKISKGDTSCEAVPASEELESAINTAIQQGQIPAQQVHVWALIRPRKYAALDPSAQDRSAVDDLIQYAILSGGRLHRVLSGGGGWGEKRGLLALDPDSEYSHMYQPSEPSFGDGQDIDAEKREILGEIAEPGDIITFYVHKRSLDADSVNPCTPLRPNSNQDTTATLVFGSLPSTMDAMPEIATSEPEAQSELVVIRNHFGMLSGQGMSLESSFIKVNRTANNMPELHEQLHGVQSSNKVTTKLDAPFTLFTIRGRASMLPVSS
ncbi:hypothetical protein BDR22DRAFT_298975 [Usnea florida]